MVYPASLTNSLNMVSNVSRNGTKMSPYRTDEVKPNQIIVLDFVPNSMVDLDTLCFHFNGKATTSAGFTSFPRNIESIISKIAVELNGLSIATCANLSDLYTLMYNLNCGYDAVAKRTLYQKGGVQVAPTADDVVTDYKVQNFLGFLGTAQGRILDLGVIGQLRLHITLESTAVLIKSSASAGEGYTLNNLYFTVDTIAIDDGVYYQAKNNFLSSGGIISIPFDNYYSAMFNVNSFSQSSRFSVSSQSVDWMLAAFVPNRVISEVDSATGNSSYFNYAAQDPTTASNTLTTWQFSVNNVTLPQYLPTKSEAMPLLLNMMGTSQSTDGGILPSITSQAVWNSKFWCAGVRLDLLTSPADRTISGLSTLGTNSTIAFTSTGTGSFNPQNLLVFVKSSAVLRVGAGKTIEIVL